MNYPQYESYIDSGTDYIGNIPSNWKIKPLFALAKENKVQNTGNIIKNVLSLSYGKIVRRNIESNMGLLPQSFGTYQIVQDGFIILRLTDLQNDKKSLRVGRVVEEGIITSAYLGLIPKKDINSQYLYYLLHSYDINKVFYNMVGGVRQSMGYADFRRMPIVLPSYTEQEKIVTFIDKKTSQIDTHIDKQERLIALLKERRTAIINKAVTRGLDESVKFKDSGIVWLGEIPEHWEVKKIGQCFIERKQKVSDKIYQPLSVTKNGIVPQLETAAKSNAGDDRKKVCINDFVINSRSDRKGSSGVSNLEGSVSLISIVLEATIEIEMQYIHHLLRSYGFQEEFYRYGKGIVDDLWSTKYSDMKNIMITIPSIDEQKSISNYIAKEEQKTNSLIENIQKEISMLKEYRQSLISNAVTGKIRVI